MVPGADLGPDRRYPRWDDTQVFLRPSERHGEAFGVRGAQIVGSGVRLGREIFDPHDTLRVCIRE